MKLPCLFQPRILREAVRAVFKGPFTTKFPFQPHKPAVSFRGSPQFQKDECVGCTACCQVCPSGALSFKDEINKDHALRIITLRLDICVFCGQCQANCLTSEGIVLTKEFDLSTLKREELSYSLEKELLLCENCNKIIAPRDQIIWVINKLESLLFSNTSLMHFFLKEVLIDTPIKIETSSERIERFKFLCPHCRREAVLKS